MRAPDLIQLRPPARGEAGLHFWLGTLTGLLNKFFTQVTQAFSAPDETKTLDVITGPAVADSFPIDFPNPLGRAPVDVHVGYISREGAVPITGAVSVSWLMGSEDLVRISYIAGLSTSARYTVRLVLR